MFILRVACDNLYMFKNFEIDFTYERKFKHPLTQGDVLFEGSRIKVRKNLILMGANASGKTTFGKLLCLILNFIKGKDLNNNSKALTLQAVQYDRKKSAKFEIEFVIEHTAYLLRAEFRDFNLYREELYLQKIYNTYNITTLREKLKNSAAVSIYNSDNETVNIGFESFVFSASKENKFAKVREQFGFWFKFSELEFDSFARGYRINVDSINKILPIIDNSVESVKKLLVEGDLRETNDCQIYFKNGDIVSITDGDLSLCKNRISHGTAEAIDFICSLDVLTSKSIDIIYVDERLAHMHSELESYLVRQTFFKKDADAQIFFTTHNAELLDMNVPINSYVFFKRNEDGFNEAIFPSKTFNKNDRNFKNYYDNDFFGVFPNCSMIDDFFIGAEQANG